MKIIWLVIVVIFALQGASTIEIGGVRTSAGCEKIESQKSFGYYSWAEGCPAYNKAEGYAFLLSRGYFVESLPECLEPTNLPYPLGEHLFGEVPKGYELVEETITSISQTQYNGYPNASSLKTNAIMISGYCYGLQAGISYTADVYAGIIKEEYFTRTYEQTCQDPDRTFPPLANNEKVLFAWGASQERAQECSDAAGQLQSAYIDCEDTFRCIKTFDEQCPRDIPVGSSVSAYDLSYATSLALIGTSATLEYTSSNREKQTTFGNGWSLSVHHSLEGDYLYKGEGSILEISKQRFTKDGLTHVVAGEESYIFDTNNLHRATYDTYSDVTLYTFSYDSTNRLVSLKDRFSKNLQIEYDDTSKIVVHSPYGHLHTIEKNDSGAISVFTYEDGSSYYFEYTNNLLSKKIDPSNNEFVYNYDANGKLHTTLAPDNAQHLFSQELLPTSMQTSIFKPMGDTIQYSDNFLTDNILESQTISPWGETASTRHNIATNTINTRTCQADKKFVYSQENDPLTRKPTLESYTLTTPEGITDTFTFATNYDYKKGILTKKETKTTSAQGVSITEVDYKKGKFTAVSPEKRKSIIEFDPQTLLPTKIRQADLEPIELEYTKEGELKKYTYGDYKAKYTYDTKGNLIKREEPYANTTYEYDLLNRLTKETRSDGTSISYTYDPKGNIEKLVVPHAKEYTQSYTHADQRELFRSPLGYTTSYTYDKQERLTKLQRASLKTIEFNYEEGRLSSLESDGITTYYTYACNTQPSSITKEEETLLYSYDGELLTRLQHEGTLNQSIDYTYNNRFLPTSLSYADQTTRYTYDKDGLLLSSGDFTLVRDKKSALVESLSDNSFILKYKYQKDGTLKKLTAKNYTLELHTDKGKIIEKKEKLGKKNNAYRYTYDTRGRLTQVKKNAKVVESYTYDANSNRLSATINGVTTSASYTLDDNLEVYGDNTYRYDTDGNLIEKTTPQGTTTYLYTTKGTLTKVVTPTNTIEYILNPLEQRVAKKVDGQITEKYLWADLTTLLAVYDANDTLTQRYNYTHNRMPTSMTQNNQTYYLHYDQVGTLKLITDINQNIIKEITYDTFGNILQDSNPSFTIPFGFAGGLYDQDTQLVHFGYREYDPYTGKWTTKDPIDFNGGDSNLYGYVLQDPVNLVDPKGLNPLGLPWRQDSVGNGKSGKFPLGNGNTIYVDKNGNIVPSKSATSNTHNKPKKEKKMSDKELCDYFGDKNWHQKGYKQDYLKDFRKALNGDKNPDFYYDKLNNNLWLRGTRDKNLWINTGDKI